MLETSLLFVFYPVSYSISISKCIHNVGIVTYIYVGCENNHNHCPIRIERTFVLTFRTAHVDAQTETESMSLYRRGGGKRVL